LPRAADRSNELALRVALGASRAELAKQLLTEAVMVSLIGGAAGLAGAQILLGVLNRWPQAAEEHLSASLDARVYLEGLLLTLGCALLFGMLPAGRAWQSSPLEMMKHRPGDANRPGRIAARDLLLGVQIAI
jgi:ABC-type antimicrobial peptide transport system permease subunit